MKYKPEPVIEEEQIEEHEVYLPGNSYTVEDHIREKITGWEVQFEEDDGGGYIFDDQDDAMMFCLLLEIRDLLRDTK